MLEDLFFGYCYYATYPFHRFVNKLPKYVFGGFVFIWSLIVMPLIVFCLYFKVSGGI
jgi:hypothetical protein